MARGYFGVDGGQSWNLDVKGEIDGWRVLKMVLGNTIQVLVGWQSAYAQQREGR
jgi:ABC-type thiamine transport system substrate-binding protein